MKKALFIIRIVVTVLLAAAALAVAAGAAYAFSYADRNKPYIEDGPGGPTETLEGFFDALAARDWETAYAALDGCASLGLEAAPEDAVGALLWNAQQGAWTFSVEPGYEMSGASLTKRAEVTSLNFDAFPAPAGERVQALLAEAVESARLRSDVYNEDGSYRMELVRSALERAAAEGLENLAPYLTRRTIELRLALVDGAWRVSADSELIAALTGGAVRAADTAQTPGGLVIYDPLPAFEMYVNNLTADALDGLVAVPKVYWLAEELAVAPAPDAEKFGSSTNGADTLPVIAAAAELMNGQEVFWNPETKLMPGSSVRWYLDDTIFAVTWKQIVRNMVYSICEVKVAHPSQFRRYLSDDSFSAPAYYRPTEMAQTVNAVVALSGDFCKFRNAGITVYRRELYRTAGRYLDVCFVDASGDLHFVPRNTITEEADALRYIEENDILFSLSFGPILIENGVNVCPDAYSVGEINDLYARCAICQLDELHYLLVTVNHEDRYTNAASAKDVANYLESLGVPNAYMLDGGQTATLIIDGETVNRVEYGYQRSISDIVYFATAIPD